MNLYKVAFSNNKAVSACQVYTVHLNNTNVSVETVNGERKVKWITIFADNERESIKLANKVVGECLGYSFNYIVE